MGNLDNEYKLATIEDFYTRRTLKGFKYGVLKDIQDLIDGNYDIEHLKSDFIGWCQRNNIKY